MGISRRALIGRIGMAGGFGAAFAAMQGLGLVSSAAAAPFDGPPPTVGQGKRVLVLGAGIAGLVLTYELERAGFEVRLLEARRRVGGRNWTIRGGDRVELIGEADQTAGFSEGHYFNAGPARIPSLHQGLLGYCKTLGVPLEVEVNSSRSALMQSDAAFGGRPVRLRQAVNDLRGELSALLAKASNRGALDLDLTPDDKARLVDFLKSYGDLSPSLTYAGSERSGYSRLPGAASQTGVAVAPLPLSELLKADTLPSVLFEDNVLMQATMFEPVGGMDQIPRALAGAIRSPIVLGAEVRSIRQSADEAAVTWRDAATGALNRETADYVVVTVPLPVLARVETDFSPSVKSAISGAVYDFAAKVAFEAPRFWEAEDIYGGLSFPSGGTGPVWYPSTGFGSPRGILIGAYVVQAPAQAFEALPLADQIARARAAVERLHPGHGGDLASPVVVDWNRAPFNLGPWIHWPEDGPQAAAFRLLNQPEGRVYFSGAHLSQLPSWQEGAVLAAHRTIGLLADRARADQLATIANQRGTQ
ncbi:MAG: FAD-dependent oxidoreductase [Caulobacteraceae bacterium]|nr:FAD-dependent oxidoreductase [Caulobacteraceae bacterium]